MEAQIMVPLDGTIEAEIALPYASALAEALHRMLVLVRVIPPTDAPRLQGKGWLPTGNAVEQSLTNPLVRSRMYFAEIMQVLRTKQRRVSAEVLRGQEIAETLAARAEHLAPGSVIVLATHRYRGVERWLLGSVAERLLGATSVPLLLVPIQATDRPRPKDVSYRTIVVPLDGSPFAEQALEPAELLATATGARLVLVSVIPELDDPGLAEGGVDSLWVQAERRSSIVHITHAQDRTAERLRTAGCVVETQQVCGEPTTAILEVCRAQQADLVVMTTHGRSGLRRLLLGSIAQGVAQRAAQPVLLIRPHTGPKPHTQSVPYTTVNVSCTWND